MGQKVNPNGFRIGVTHTWSSTWFARGRKYRDLFLQDVMIKRWIMDKLPDAGISSLAIDRDKRTTVTIETSKPGIIIGKQGASIEEMKKNLERKFGGNFEVNIQEVRNPDADAYCIAENIQGQMQRRMPYRRAAKMAIEKANQAGVKGIKIRIAGRLNGAEIARNEYFKDGSIPLQTIRADIQFCKKTAHTTYGTIGIKVWIYKGMVFKKIQEVQSANILDPK